VPPLQGSNGKLRLLRLGRFPDGGEWGPGLSILGDCAVKNGGNVGEGNFKATTLQQVSHLV